MQKVKKVALITGANKGIGFEVARRIAKTGWTVLAAARSEELGRQAVAKLQAEGLDVQYIHIDLDAPESAAIAAEITRKQFASLISSSTTLLWRVRATDRPARSP